MPARFLTPGFQLGPGSRFLGWFGSKVGWPFWSRGPKEYSKKPTQRFPGYLAFKGGPGPIPCGVRNSFGAQVPLAGRPYWLTNRGNQVFRNFGGFCWGPGSLEFFPNKPISPRVPGGTSNRGEPCSAILGFGWFPRGNRFPGQPQVGPPGEISGNFSRELKGSLWPPVAFGKSPANPGFGTSPKSLETFWVSFGTPWFPDGGKRGFFGFKGFGPSGVPFKPGGPMKLWGQGSGPLGSPIGSRWYPTDRALGHNGLGCWGSTFFGDPPGGLILFRENGDFRYQIFLFGGGKTPPLVKPPGFNIGGGLNKKVF